MAFPYELRVGLRYTRAKRRNHFISFISMISICGIALGVAALIVVMSVMNGFHTELRGRILAAVAHVQISGASGEMSEWPHVAEQAAKQPGVVAAAPYIQEQGMLAYGSTVRGVMVRGVVPELEKTVDDFHSHMKIGQLESLVPDSFNIVLGSDLARALGAKVGSKVTLISPQGAVTPAGVLPRMKTFTVSAVFEVGMYEYDNGLALIGMADAQKLYRMEDRVSGVRLKLEDLFKSRAVVERLASTLNTEAFISDWTQSHANFFRAVAIEKNMMFIILSLIVAVAAFNIVSTLVMAVTDKQSDIAILRTLGASPPSIMGIFMVQGALIGTIGLGLGVLGGVILALNVDVVVPFIERMLGTQLFSKEVYYIDTLPSELQWSDVITITAVSFVLSLVATIYPSWRASRVNPAEALRYE